MDDELTVLVDRLRRDRRIHPHRGRREYAQAARELADACDRLMAGGEAARTVPVLRKAVDRMTRALTVMDDSSGIVGDVLQSVMGLYAGACAAAPPKPATLASWLVALEFDGPGWPRVRLRDFAPALGERGIAAVERLVEERATMVDPDSWGGAFAVRDMREQLAEVSGDLDRYVAVLAESLRSAAQYERIVLALLDVGHRPEAIDWARRGLDAHTSGPRVEQLRTTLVGMLLDAGETEDAVAVRRAEFERRPTRGSYFALADLTGTDEAYAITVFTERIARDPVYSAEYVDVLLALGRDDEAWQAGGEHRRWVGGPQWVTLLERRRRTHPAEVIGLYEELIEQHVLDSADGQRYRRAVALLPALRDAYGDDRDAFEDYLAALRARHTRRPTFLKTLDAAVRQLTRE
ncbi:hypothetical protein Aca07nite_25490 [Actinoplanes capillaceus]|uniref:Uncharacterized protein n=1 Tax=Actinoplanes campanulatus TaxID=113559 RepID=A0ABQ3WE25_9ACTN|nr:hypothetical protein [Actinoplanes capillaceus]GID45274.1 hypothetical protein Aca07nite_25490 [Actinoplanes capillaceus]